MSNRTASRSEITLWYLVSDNTLYLSGTDLYFLGGVVSLSQDVVAKSGVTVSPVFKVRVSFFRRFQLHSVTRLSKERAK
jgi:hypothetical protein